MEVLDDSPFPYEPLDASTSMIRLLKFSARENDSTKITACIENWSLDSPEIPPFTPVSYTWGPPRYSNAIHLQGHAFPVLDQLYPFLQTILDEDHNLPPESRWWIDSICINQGDNTERSSQVQLMRRIYRQGSQTIVWLGQESSDSAEAVEFFHFLCEQARSQRMTDHDVTWLRGHHFRLKWRALENLLRRPWWKRVWTLQEFIIPRRLAFFCGRDSFSRNTMRDGLSAVWLCEHPGGVDNVRLLSYHSAWNRRRLYEWFTFRQKVTVQSDKNALRAVATIAFLGDCEATDPRDRIYSVLGLADDFETVDQPDYDRSIREVYIDFVTSFVQVYQSLDIVCFAHLFRSRFTSSTVENAEKLPSWVPDWTVKVQPEVVPLLVSQSGGRHISNFRPHHSLSSTAIYKACGEKLPCVKYSTDFATMTCTGIVIDQMDGLGSTSGCSFSHSTSAANFRLHDPSLSPVLSSATSSDSDLSAVPSTEVQHLSARSSDSELSDIDILDNDLDLLDIELAEIEVSNDENQEIPLAEHPQHRASTVEAISQSLVFGRTDKYLRDVASMEDDRAAFLALCHAAQQGHEFLNPVFKEWYQNNKYLSIRGHTIDNLITQTNASEFPAPLLDLQDGPDPTSYLARFLNSTQTLERRLAVTAQGHVGMAPLCARKHDFVCVLFGCSVPVVLRLREDDLSYEFVGEMYLHGFMDGEVIDQLHQGKLEVANFTLS